MRNIDYKQMGQHVRTQRELLGYTREQLAEALDVSTKFCADIELGVKGMSIQTLAKLSDLLCMSTDEILFGATPNAQLHTLSALIAKCPEQYQTELIAIIRAFLSAVEKG